MAGRRGDRRLDRIISVTQRRPLPVFTRYAVALGTVVIVSLVRALIAVHQLPYLLFVPAILMIALVLGRGPGVFATFLSAAIAAWFFLGTEQGFNRTSSDWVATGLFVLICLGIVTLCAELRAAFKRADREVHDRRAAQAALEQSRNNYATSEAFLRSILASSNDCIKVLDLDGNLTFMSDGGMKVMEVSDFNAILGRPWPEFWSGKGHAEALAALDAARAGRSSQFGGIAQTMAGNARWWDVAVTPILDADGKPARILAVSRDVTVSKEAERERAQLARIVENSSDFIGLTSPDGRVNFINDAGRALIGLDADKTHDTMIADYFMPEEQAKLRDIVLPALAETGYWSGELLFRHFKTGGAVPVLYTVFPVEDHDRSLVGYGTVTRDFTAHKRAEQQQRLLNNELSHRLKNTLAVVQAIASQTFRQADDLAQAREAFSARLVALGQAHNILTATSWEAADLTDLVQSVLRPHGGDGERVRIDGPALSISSRCALALALALHELGTNAVKYGALSNDTGFVAVKWHLSAGTDIADSRFHLSWQEIGGPPVLAPTQSGFGSTMIDRSLRAYTGGQTSLSYEPDGLIFILDAPASEVRVRDGGE